MRCKTYICLDTETTSKNANSCQIIELAAVAVDSQKLEIIGEFESLIKPSYDLEYCKKYNLDPISDEIYKLTNISEQELKKAPEPKVVWNNFCSFVNNYNYKKSKWDAPVIAGYNILNYDMKIINRLCGAEPYKFGPFDDEYKCNSLFNPIFKIDMMDIVYMFFESTWHPKSLSFDSLRNYFGMSAGNSHRAMFDTKQTAQLLVRFLKLIRSIAKETKFEGAFGENNNKSSE